jgi:hypothetical protein
MSGIGSAMDPERSITKNNSRDLAGDGGGEANAEGHRYFSNGPLPIAQWIKAHERKKSDVTYKR